METKTERNTPQPGSVFMTINALYQPMFLGEVAPKYNFAEFVKDNVHIFCDDQKYLPDYWIFRCDLPDKTMFPPIWTYENEDCPQLIAKIMTEMGTGPTEVVRLRDVAFCYEHGIDPLSDAGRHHNLIHNADYIAEAPRYGTGLHVICAGEAVFPTWTAIESAEGILLFTDRDNATAWLQYQADHFFDKDFATDRLRIWDVAGLDPSALSRINTCKLPEELASTSFVKTIDTVGTPAILKCGICRAEYDMGPSLSNFIALMESPQHDLLKLSIRNRRIVQLLHICEKGELPQNFNREDWIGTTLSHLVVPRIWQGYSSDQLKELARSLTERLYPDTRTGPGFKIKLLEQKQKHLDALKTGTGKPGTVRRAVPSLPNGRIKRTQNL